MFERYKEYQFGEDAEHYIWGLVQRKMNAGPFAPNAQWARMKPKRAMPVFLTY